MMIRTSLVGLFAFVASVTVLPAACNSSASFTPPSGVVTATWTVPADYGSCSGNDYVAIADPTQCAGCTTVAYAYCDGSSYSECSCDPPAAGSDWTEVTLDLGEAGSDTGPTTDMDSSGDAVNTEASVEGGTEDGSDAGSGGDGDTDAGSGDAGTG